MLGKIKQDELKATKSTFKVAGTEELRLKNFKREFVVRLTTILNAPIQTKETQIDFVQAAMIMHDMGFVQSRVSQEQETLVDDLYTVLKATKEDKVLADNLQNLLLTISGEVDTQHIDES